MTEWDFYSSVLKGIIDGPVLGGIILRAIIICLCVMVVLERKTKIKPFTSFLHSIGRVINEEMIQEQKDLKDQLQLLHEEIDQNHKEMQDSDQKLNAKIEQFELRNAENLKTVEEEWSLMLKTVERRLYSLQMRFDEKINFLKSISIKSCIRSHYIIIIVNNIQILLMTVL